MYNDSRDDDFLACRIAFEEKAEDIRQGMFLPKLSELLVGYPPYMGRWEACVSRWSSDTLTEIGELRAANIDCYSPDTVAAFEKVCTMQPTDSALALLVSRIGADHRRIGPNYPIVDEALLRAQYYLSYPLHGHHSGTIAKACFKRFQSGANLYEGLQAFLLGMRVQAGKLADDTVGHSSIVRLCDMLELDARSDQAEAREERKAQAEAAEEHAKASVEGRTALIRRTRAKLKDILDDEMLPAPRQPVVLEDDIPVLVDAADLESEREKAEGSKARRRVLEAFKRSDPEPQPAKVPEPPGIVVIPEGREYGKQTRMLAGKRLPLVPGSEPAAVRRVLIEEFPYAEEAVDALCRDLVGKAYARIRPTMLHGYAGAGKTRLARRFAELAGLPSLIYAASSTADSSWAGTSKQWASARISNALQATVSWGQANGVIIVDEADKCGESRQNGRFSDSLLPFLERESSGRIFDPALECEVNLSGLSYIATCNDLHLVPAPLRDRFRVVKIGHPRKEHLPQIARTMVADLRAERETDEVWMPDLNPDELELLAKKWQGGRSMRVLARIVDLLVTSRDALATRN